MCVEVHNVNTAFTHEAEQLPGCQRAQFEALLKGEEIRSCPFGSCSQRRIGGSRQPDPVSTLQHASDERVDLFLPSSPDSLRVYVKQLQLPPERCFCSGSLCSSHNFRNLKNTDVDESTETASPGTPS